MKQIREAAGDPAYLEGTHLKVHILHNNFVTNSRVQVDRVDMYFPEAALARFVREEITDQELIDASVVIVDGNRTKLSLSDG